MPEIRKILAAPGKRVAVVKANGVQVRSKRGALCITDEGLYDEAAKLVLQAGPVAVEWSDFYARVQRDGDLVVVPEAKPAAKAAAEPKASARGKGESR